MIVEVDNVYNVNGRVLEARSFTTFLSLGPERACKDGRLRDYHFMFLMLCICEDSACVRSPLTRPARQSIASGWERAKMVGVVVR